MRSHPHFALAVLSVLLIAVGASPCLAGGGSATVHVSATVRPYLKFSAIQPVTSYQVTQEDIRRGHIDISRAVIVHYQTNVHEEIQFEIASSGPERVIVPGSGEIFRAGGALPGVPVTRNLDLRIILPSGIQEGVYPLQIALAPTAY